MEERLKTLRKELSLTQQAFSDRLGIQRSTYSKYELGTNIPTDAVINLICDRFHVNETWLRTGEGDMFVEISRDDELQRLIDASMNDEAGEIKRRIAAAVMRLSPEQLRICTDWIKETFDLVDSPATSPAMEAAAVEENPEPLIAATAEEREAILQLRRQKEEIASAG